MTIFVLIGSLVVFRTLGALGVRRFESWPASAAHALALMLLMTGTAHFMPAEVTVMPNYADMVAIVPPFVPFPGFIVLASGVLEILAAIGLVLPRTRRITGLALIPLFVLLLPANIHAAINDIPFAGEPASPLWQRVPEQVLYIAVALWAARTPTATPLTPTRVPAGH